MGCLASEKEFDLNQHKNSMQTLNLGLLTKDIVILPASSFMSLLGRFKLQKGSDQRILIYTLPLHGLNGYVKVMIIIIIIELSIFYRQLEWLLGKDVTLIVLILFFELEPI